MAPGGAETRRWAKLTRMAAGHDANVHDDHGHDAPLQDDPDHAAAAHGGHAAQDDPHGHDDSHDPHDAHGHDDHHDDHGPVDDRWVLPPILVGLVIGVIIVVLLGFASGAASIV